MTRRINAPDDVLLPVREVEVQLPVERDPEGGQHEGGEVAGAGGHLLVAEVGQAARGAAVDVQRLPHRELGHPQHRVPHVVQHLAVDFYIHTFGDPLLRLSLTQTSSLLFEDINCHLADTVASVRQEGSLRPVQDVEDNMPEAEVTKGDAKVDQEPPPDPAQVGKAAGGLVVVGEEEVVSEGDAEPDQVGAEQERVAGRHLDPPPGRGHRRILGGVAGGLGLDTSKYFSWNHDAATY